MHFEPVWISSVEHLAKFQSIFQETSWLGRALGRYKMPPDFPCIQVKSGMFSVSLSPRIPIIMFSQGQLDVEEGVIRFQAMNWDSPAGKRLNLQSDWNFQLKAEEISAVEKFECPSPVLRYYDMNFTRVRTHNPNQLSDFLLCVGGLGPSMTNIRQHSEELQQKLFEMR